MGIYKRILVTLDPETLEILKVYKLAGYTTSGTIRKAVENYFRFNKPKVTPSYFDGVDVSGDGGPVINLN